MISRYESYIVKVWKNDNFIIQLRKGVFDLAILSLISKQPMYGYEITSALQDIPVFHIPNGSIYPILNRITKIIGLFPIGKSLVMGSKRKILSHYRRRERNFT